MNVDEAMRRFAEPGDLPREAVQWALDNWDAASPRFIAKLRAYAAGASRSDGDVGVLFFILLLCGEKHESRAYVPLCDMIATDETFYDSFGDVMIASLTGILINVCDDDVEPLKHAIETPEGDEYCRAGAIEALAYLVRAEGVLGDDEMRDYLVRLASELQPREEHEIWTAWAFAIAQLGYDSLRADVARVFAKKWIDPMGATLDDFHQDLALARRDPDGMAAFSAAGVEPFGSVIETLEELSYGEPEESDGDNADFDFDFSAPPRVLEGAPFVNPLRDVGRNDPCPCGSGKKYKKCCLAA
jgi:hypothetical protein